jgi:hypothetical protein
VSLVVVVSIACDQPLGTGVLAEKQSTSPTAGRFLEFDLPPEHVNKDADGQFVITGYRLGTFRAGESVPLVTTDVPRDAVAVNGKVGRVALATSQLPTGDVSGLVIRMQTVSRSGASEWSAPSPVLSTAGAPARATGGRSGRARVSMTDVDRHPRLAESLRKSLGQQEPEDVLMAFRSLDDLALAVVICRDQDIAFDTLTATLVGPPRRSVRVALRELKPSLRGTDAMQKARAEAKQLLQP